MQEGPAFASRALAAGAHGYLLKEAAETELLTALHAVMGGAHHLDPRVGAALASNAELERRDPVLTDRERQVVRLLAMGRTNAQVAEALHASASGPSSPAEHRSARSSACATARV